MPHRSLATVFGLLVLASGGCLAGGPAVGSSPTDAGDALATARACDGDEVAPDFGISDRDLSRRNGGFELTASDGTVERGHSITFDMTNVASETKVTGTAARYALQRPAGGGWETVTLFREPILGFNATAISHAPGTGFSWTFRASAAGFSRGKYLVCEPLVPGTYRFVYAGSDVAVEFEIRDATASAAERTGPVRSRPSRRDRRDR